MPQPGHTDPAHPLELDPLLDFPSEQPSAPEPVERAPGLSPEIAEQFAELFEPARPVTPDETRGEAAEELRGRVGRAEQLLEQSMSDLAALKSDLATLVSTVEEIRKRHSRREGPPPAPARPPSRLSGTRLMMAAVVLAAFATAIWGLVTSAPSEAAEPPAIQTEPAEPVSTPPRVGAEVPAAEPRSTANAVEPAPPSAGVPRANPPPRAAPPPRAVNYVGTLSVDADPAGEVFLNRERVGHTPLRLEKLRAGSHLVWIQREGYRRWTRVVAVPAGRVSRVSASLEPISR